jgi:hypothetical protein
VLAFIQSLAEKYRPSVIAIESVQYQAAVVEELLRSTNLPIQAVRPDKDKLTRFLPLEARYEQCVAKGTMVRTQFGETPIENIRAGDFVWTRKGLRRVLWSGQTGIEQTMSLRVGNVVLRCTGNHPIWEQKRGFVRADSLVPKDDMLLVWQTQEHAKIAAFKRQNSESSIARLAQQNIVGLLANLNVLMSNFKVNVISSKKTSTGNVAGTKATNYFTETCGLPLMAQFPKVGTYTTKTTTLPTTAWKIWLRFAASVIQRFTIQTVSPNQTPHTTSFARSAEPNLQAAGTLPNIVATGVDELCMPLLSGTEEPQREAVYNLHVEEDPEYFANGILVHNCLVYHAPNLMAYTDELLSFPAGAHDDLVDAAAYAYNALTGTIARVRSL